ncbi:MAG: tetratricopeptide repeat protein [Cytophagales bacterium]|nr:MAG: tetratricopeptide repeat protein [Cytophagales bacterium]TAF60306.1 MAG: tetratricopeptide repeat protein [Cytophagales bacterium]
MRAFLVVCFLCISFCLQAQKDSLSFYIQKAQQEEKKGNAQQALNYYLKAAFIEESNKGGSEQLATIYEKIGGIYQARKVYQKSLDYFSQAYQLSKSKSDESARLRHQQGVAASYYYLKDLAKAAEVYEKALDEAKRQQDNTATRQILGKLFLIEESRKNYDKAIVYVEESLSRDDPKQDFAAMSNNLNNLGFLYRKKGDFKKAQNAFEKSLELNKTALSKLSGDARAITLLNIGVIYTNLEDDKNALKSFNEALSIREKAGKPAAIAEAQNYIAKHYLVTAYYDPAENTALAAAENAKKAKDFKILLESYQILADTYRKMGNYKRSDEYAQLKVAANDSLIKSKEAISQTFQKTQIAAEREESEFRLLLAEKQKQELVLRQITLEAEKKAKEIEINKQEIAALEKDKKLQQADKESQIAEKLRAQQELVIAQQRLLNEKKQQELIAVQKEQALQALALEQQKRKSDEAELQKQKAESLQKLATAEKEKEKENSRLIIYGSVAAGILSLIIIALVLWSLVSKRKDNKKLEAQAQELQKAAILIQEKNDILIMSEEELRQNMEELESQRDALQAITNRLEAANVEIQGKNDELATSEEELKQNLDALGEAQIALVSQKEKLAIQNQNIIASIHYAKRIQNAILPNIADIRTVFPESFVLYKPRDVVAGDFYWMNKSSNTHADASMVIFAVGDCTGHGVPGAFMTLIGNTLLNQIVNENDIYNPSLILSELDKRLVNTLKQDDSDNKLNDGMDIAVIAYNKNTRQTLLSSAKRPTWFYKEGQLIEYKGSKFPIGGQQQSEKIFDIQEIELSDKNEKANNRLYLFTDGFVDQFGGPDNKRFMTKNFRALIEKAQALEMKDQRDYLDGSFEKWRGEYSQLDDVLVVGMVL